MATFQTPVSPGKSACNPHQSAGSSRVAYQIGGISFGMFADRGVALTLDKGIRELRG